MEMAYQAGIVPWHLYGATQAKTLHARLSEDIARSPERSRFFRTAPGVFFLQRFRGHPDVPIQHTKIHLAPPRRKDLRRGQALCLSRKMLEKHTDSNGWLSLPDLEAILSAGDYGYVQKTTALKQNNILIPLSSFVIVHVDGSVLSYRVGRYSAMDDDLAGLRSIGFGDIVSDKDVDLLYDSYFGLRENAIRDLIYAIGLEQDLAQSARYNNLVIPRFAYLCESSGTLELKVVMSYKYTSEAPIGARTVAFSDLRWMPIAQKVNNTESFEPTSRAILEHDWCRPFEL